MEPLTPATEPFQLLGQAKFLEQVRFLAWFQGNPIGNQPFLGSQKNRQPINLVTKTSTGFSRGF